MSETPASGQTLPNFHVSPRLPSLPLLSLDLSLLTPLPLLREKVCQTALRTQNPRLLETPSTPPPPTHTPKPTHTHTQQLSTTINNTSLTRAKCSLLARSSYGNTCVYVLDVKAHTLCTADDCEVSYVV